MRGVVACAQRLALVAMALFALVLAPQAARAAIISNTASITYDVIPGDPTITQDSNTTQLATGIAPSPAVVTFWQYAPPGTPHDVTYLVDGGDYDAGAAAFLPLAGPVTLRGNPIPVTAPVPLREADVYHAGEPVFITVADANRNLDPLVRETVELTVTTTTGDTELLRLVETGPATGIFAAVIQSEDPSLPVTANDGRLSLDVDEQIDAFYQDPFYPTDQAQDRALVDPFGRVFDSGTGNPLSGVTVTLLNADTGLPAQVFGDDGFSSFPSTVVTGGTFTDSSGNVYVLPAGGFRFPFVAPGNYRFVVTPAGDYAVPSTVAPGALPNDPDGNPYSIVDGSYLEVFAVVPGPALNIDIPADPPVLTGTLLMQKQASTDEATVGDFLRYALSVENRGAVAATNTVVTDTLPRGLRFEAGSLRLDGVKLADPAIAADGRTLTIPVGTLAAGATATLTYTVRVVAMGGDRQAVNSAQAAADGGASSNVARAVVALRDFLMSNAATVVGRVVESPCDTPWDKLKGVPGVRLLTQDGTYVATDRDGLYHLEGIRPGTHVVQLDLATLPDGYEPVSCIDNTRFAGRAYSQFVEVQGGALWRADFYLRPKPAPAPLPDGEAGIRLETLAEETVAAATPAPQREYTFHGKFASCEDELLPGSVPELKRLLASLRKSRVEKLEITGHTDNQRLSAACRAKFTDNHGLSAARAKTIATFLAEGLGLDPAQVVITGKGPDEPLAGNESAAGMAKNRRVDVVAYGTELPDSESFAGDRQRTHRLQVDVAGVAASNVRPTVVLPRDVVYVPGSSALDGAAIEDPQDAGGALAWRLPAGIADGTRVLTFDTRLRVAVPVPGSATEKHTFYGQFASCENILLPESYAELLDLMRKLRRSGAERLQVIGHTDNQALSPECRAAYRDNVGLSRARAQAIADMAARALRLDPANMTVSGKGDRAPQASNATPEGMARNRRVEVIVQAYQGAEGGAGATCEADGHATMKAMVMVDTEGAKNQRLPVVTNRVPCDLQPAAPAAAPDRDSGRQAMVLVRGTPEAAKPAKAQPPVETDPDKLAGGYGIDWLAQAQPGAPAILFPAADHNPRTPVTRVVVQHAPAQRVELVVNGAPAAGINFDGVSVDKRRDVAVSTWRGLPLADGANLVRVRVIGPGNAVVAELERTIHYSGEVVRAEFIAAASQLVADGVTRPRIAVRFTDRDGRPARSGLSVAYQVGAPYRAYEGERHLQERQLAGIDRFMPQAMVAGDDGIAFIELAPTTDAGEVVLAFNVQSQASRVKQQEVRAWLASAARDWVLVGFAEGTVGHSTLEANSLPLPAGEEDGGYSDGQVAFYAKGRVLGKWLLTLAYDTGKPGIGARRGSLLSTIDPDEFYTLYGDGSGQRYDAASQSKLYVKLERGQFYALFGDYDTGLTVTELSRYTRTLNGLKLEKGGDGLTFSLFAAETTQDNMRDEIRGNGTSGLYRLSRDGIVINSERIVIEVRDRYTGAVLSTRTLARHIDYDIDYSGGTLFFREPIVGRDASFNPVFIVAAYETFGNGAEEVTAGGRVALDVAGGRAEVGVSAITETQLDSDQQLVGVDATVQVGKAGELRVEAAQTDGEESALPKDGTATLVQYEHHDAKVDALAYVRRQEPGFGLRQQNAGEAGVQKIGAEGQYRLDGRWALTGEVYRLDNLASDAARDVAAAGVRWKKDATTLAAGVSTATDASALGETLQSEQLNLGATHALLDRRLELKAEADFGLSPDSNENPDYPDRVTLGATYALNTVTRLIAAQEFTRGEDYDTSLTRAGIQVVPWGGARLESTLNQQDIGEHGPRTFAQYGLTQSLLSGERWGADLTLDGSNTLHQAGLPAVVVNPNQPSAVAGGATLTDDYAAVSGGLTYRAPVWSWNGRLEVRDGNTTDRLGFVTRFLRQAKAGVAFAADARAFTLEQSSGTTARDLTLGASWAWRPLGSRWSLLERLEYKYESLTGGLGQGGLFSYDSLDVAGDGRSSRLINNLALNRVSREWTARDREGNLFQLNQRNQWSLYYGAKYVADRIDGVDYQGYTDMLAAEVRHDLTREWDVGVQASTLHAWEPGTVQYSFGPSIGWSPFTNAWLSVGYNLRGFEDPDFSQARWTAEGAYLKVRVKFDQNTRWRKQEEATDAVR